MIAAFSLFAEARALARRTRVAICGGSPALGFVLAAALLLPATPARADLRLCNMTTSRIGIAIGYRDQQGWITEGWWNLNARACETLLKGQLAARFYYVYGVDYDRGGEWSGRSFMCTRDREFTIRGVEDCFARGFDRSAFFEVDTGEQKSWTIQLMDPGRMGTALQ
ncbi:MAG TPA: DUF1036 domain-containing protein [Beijerinckiaceae bacterium]|jgi:uncharacterized membrane protein